MLVHKCPRLMRMISVYFLFALLASIISRMGKMIASNDRLKSFFLQCAQQSFRELGLKDFLPLLHQPAVEGRSEPQRIYQTVRNTARPGPLDDDFSYLVMKFA